MDLLDEFLTDKEVKYYWSNYNAPKLFYLWGHSYEFNNDNNWEIIEKFCQKAGNREDVWYATNIEIYNYAKAYDSLVFSANRKWVYNPTCYDIYLNWMGVNVLAKAGETTRLED
jgi:hypothetical protein